MGGAELDYCVPGAALQPYLGLFYRFSARPGAFADTERAASAQLRFRLSPGGARYRFADGYEQAAPPLHVVGPTTGATEVLAEGPVLVFGCGLSPAGWAALIGTDASLLVNRCVDATALFGAGVRDAATAVAGGKDCAAMVAALTPWLTRQLTGDHGAALAFARAVDGWLAGTLSPALGVLEAATGLSRRQVERRCNALYGCPPKLLARKYRALRAAVAMAAGEEPAPDCFYDQSHLIREVKHFTGLTPGRLRDEPGLLAALTMARRRALEGQVGVLVSAT